MAKPEQFGIDIDSIVNTLAEAEGISIETPHKVTPGTAKALARRAVLTAFEQLSVSEKPSLPKWDVIVLGGTKDSSFSQPGLLRKIDEGDLFGRPEEGLGQRTQTEELENTISDLVRTNVNEAQVRSLQSERERTA